MTTNRPNIILVLLVSVFFLFSFASDLSAQIYNISTEDGNSITTCSGIFLDSDSVNSDIYYSDESYLVTFCTDAPGECLEFNFTSFDVPDGGDWLYVWDGADTASATFVGAYNNPLGNNTNNIITLYPNGIQATSGCFTFLFQSDGDFITGSGWEATISCEANCATCNDGIQNGTETGIDCGGVCEPCPEPINIADGGTVNTCGSVFTDSGGEDNDYSNSESNTITICSDNPNPSFCLQAVFSEFSTENGWDYLYIYDGASTSAPVIGAYTGNNSPGSISATGSCLTFFFSSDFIIANYDGWVADISCGECAADPIPSIADCLGSLSICEDVQNEPLPDDGAGNVSNELPSNACGVLEVNVLWYVFDITTDGIFNFSLDADPQTNGDYDWALYDITGLTCDNISSATSVSCNTWGLFSGSGNTATGISTANGGTGNANGPGDLNGPAFNADVNVLAGESYALVISNCCDASAGFEIDFSGSTADIFDSYPPAMQEVIPSCANNEVSILFSEQIDCSTFGELDFEIVGANGTFTVSSFSADWCDVGNEGALTVDLFLDGVLDENETYVLTITNADGGIADLCGNVNDDESMAFTTSSAMTIESILEPSDCAGTLATGSAEITVIGGTAPFYVEMGSQNDYDVDVFIFENLLDGPQEVNVYDFTGCQATFYVDIPTSNSFMENEIIITNVSCIGGDGEIEIFTSGEVGFGPWEYVLTDTTGTVIFTASNTDYINIINLVQGNYLISIEDLSGLSPCSDLQEIIIDVPDSIIVSTVNDTTICYNGQANIAAWVEGGSSSSFTLYWDDGSNSFTNNPGQFFSSGVLTENLIYNVYAQDDLGCVSDTISMSIAVSDLLSFEVSSDQEICAGSELEIGVNNIIGGYGSDYEVVWDLGDGILIPSDSVIVIPSEPTSYCVQVSDQCETPDVDTCIFISPILVVDVSFTIDSETESCPPYLVNFTNTTPFDDVGTATWYFGDGEQSQNVTSASHIYTDPGNYNVGLSIITPDGCVFDTLVENAITIHPLPNPFFVMSSNITTLQNTTIDFDNQSTGATSYYWVFDTINNFGESYEENPSFVFPDQLPDEYFIKLYAYSSFGCENSITQLLIINDDLAIYVPNSFSPNGDGDNDYFFVQGVAIDPQAFSLIIFDRWGQKVFETNDIHEKWNGSVNGSDYYAQPGAFVYFLSYQLESTTDRKEIQGSVTLLK